MKNPYSKVNLPRFIFTKDGQAFKITGIIGSKRLQLHDPVGRVGYYDTSLEAFLSRTGGVLHDLEPKEPHLYRRK